MSSRRTWKPYIDGGSIERCRRILEIETAQLYLLPGATCCKEKPLEFHFLSLSGSRSYPARECFHRFVRRHGKHERCTIDRQRKRREVDEGQNQRWRVKSTKMPYGWTRSAAFSIWWRLVLSVQPTMAYDACPPPLPLGLITWPRWGVALGAGMKMEDSLWAGLTDSHAGLPMGMTAENLAEQVYVCVCVCV